MGNQEHMLLPLSISCLSAQLSLSVILRTRVDTYQDAALLLLELSVYPSAAAHLFAAKVQLVAATLSWQHENTRSVTWTGKTSVLGCMQMRASACLPRTHA